MSISTFVQAKEHVAKLKVLRPPPPRALGVPLIVPPRSHRYGPIGTAFDYLLRFEIERWAPHAKTDHWVAQSAAETFFIQQQQPDGSYRSVVPDAELAKVVMPVDESPNTVERFPIRRPGEVQHHSVVSAYKIGSRALSIVHAAKAAHQRYIVQHQSGARTTRRWLGTLFDLQS